MKTSTDRMLTTHIGSLPRPPALLAAMRAHEAGLNEIHESVAWAKLEALAQGAKLAAKELWG
ncbi:MAG TPA: hypothetical protein VI759_07795 [Dehalococcoidia bacterium]|nr:hypothetical protein [Dehalococcoidia bacterium]